MNIFFWILQFFAIIALAGAFQYKTVCLLDYAPTEEELEGEWEGGIGRPGAFMGMPPGNYPANGGYYGDEYEGDEGEEWGGGMMGGAGTGAGAPGIAGPGGPGYGMGIGMGGAEMDEYEGMGGPGGVFGMAGPSPWPGAGGEMGPTNTQWRGQGSSGGYVDADGEWEDARRKKRRRRGVESIIGMMMNGRSRLSTESGKFERAEGRRAKRQIGGVGGMGMWRASPHTPVYLRGKLSCNDQSKIHILNVTLGYSRTPDCAQAAYYGCRGSSSKATQVLNCQGVTGSCDVTIARHFLSRCGKSLNFASIAFECIPETRRVDICSSHDSDHTGGVVISSPSYPLVGTNSGSNADDILTCECTIRASAESSIRMEYLRASLPGQYGTCEGDLLLLETPEQSNDGRYTIVAEICGTNYTTKPQDIYDNILRITFLGGSPVQHSHGGFIGKFTAISSDGDPSLFHMSCQPPAGGGSKETNGNGNSQGVIGGNGNSQGIENGEEKKSSSPGVLSGVVASLASVILIMGSVGALLVYNSIKSRRRRRAEERDRRRSFSGSDVDRPPPTNSQRFFTEPRQIVRPPSSSHLPQPPPPPPMSHSTTTSGHRPASPVPPSYRAPPPPDPDAPTALSPILSRNVYCIATEVPEDSDLDSNPELASAESLPPTVTLRDSPSAQRRNKKKPQREPGPPTTQGASTSVGTERVVRVRADAVPEPPYDNAAASRALKPKPKETSKVGQAATAAKGGQAREKRNEKKTEGAEIAVAKESGKYEEPVSRSARGGNGSAVAVDVHRRDEERGHLERDGEDIIGEEDSSCSSGSLGPDERVVVDEDGNGYSSIDEMHTIVTSGVSSDDTDA